MLSDAPLVAFVPTVDLERSHAFYGGVLGLTRVESSPFANGYDANGTALRVTRVERHDPPPFTVLGWQARDIAAIVAALRAAGVQPID
jgi:catechol 2,3-dioxygenase-like lactoylglutathione lyase family enzyme